MTSSASAAAGPRRRAAGAAAALLLLAVGAMKTSAAGAGAPGDELPDGPGKKVLQTACTTCHDLDEVVKFKGYYTRPQWRDIVVTMVEYGAQVEKTDVDVLTDYLTETIGKKD